MRAAVIGIGHMGARHARVWAEMGMLCAVADTNSQFVSEVSSRYGVIGYESYQVMLDRERPDVVSVAVPTSLHKRIAVEILSRQIPCLVEKPMAIDSRECQDIIDAARGVPLGVGHVEVFNPVVRRAKELLPLLGGIYSISTRRLTPTPPRVKTPVSLDLATHDVAVMRWLLGSEVEDVESERVGDDAVVGLLRFANGVVGVVEADWISPSKVRTLSMLGANGRLEADYIDQTLYFCHNDMVERMAVERKEPLRCELEAFLACCRDGDKFDAIGDDGLRAVEVAERLMA